MLWSIEYIFEPYSPLILLKLICWHIFNIMTQLWCQYSSSHASHHTIPICDKLLSPIYENLLLLVGWFVRQH